MLKAIFLLGLGFASGYALGTGKVSCGRQGDHFGCDVRGLAQAERRSDAVVEQLPNVIPPDWAMRRATGQPVPLHGDGR